MNLDDLKRLAGITDHRGINTVSESGSGVMARPGTEEWFTRPVNDMQMPTGFRGRKKK
jgi:hypothetical protein